MFKAPIKVASHNPISNKDRKKLKKDLCKFYPSDVVDIIFINSPEISATKLQNSSIIIYSDEEFPLFVDSTSNGDFFPSCRLPFDSSIFPGCLSRHLPKSDLETRRRKLHCKRGESHVAWS